MAQVHRGNGRFPTRYLLLGTMAGLGVMLAARRNTARQRRHRDSVSAGDAHAALRAYLLDHLTGSDAALTVVDRLRTSHESTPEGRLFASLAEEFGEERTVLTAVLASMGESATSVKRVFGQAAGQVLKSVSGGDHGDLALFRTLESLCIGVQGKRCLWRTLQLLSFNRELQTSRTFLDLERQAVDQWMRLDECRRSLISSTFGTRIQ
jgi:hypothetical protein